MISAEWEEAAMNKETNKKRRTREYDLNMVGFYGAKSIMSKSIARRFWIVLALVSLGLLVPSAANAVDRVSYVSVSTLFPYAIKPTAESADTTCSMKFAVFFENTFASVFGADFGLTKSERLAFTAGVQWYLDDTNFIDPYLTASLLYKLDGENKPGWRTTVGAEWNARAVSNMDNLRFFVESGASFVFADPQQLWFEIVHVGASWHF